MRIQRVVTTIMAVCGAVAVSAVLAEQVAPTPHHAAADKAKPAPGMPAKCQAMVAEHEKMMADMKVADQRLDDLVSKMNTASGSDKVAATAAVVTELVTQRRAMRDGMMKMQHGMMGHMMEHMQADKGSTAMCPMMKSKGGMGDMKH